MRSSSGAIFGTIARLLIEEDGATVVGAALSGDCKAVGHIAVDTVEGLEPLYGSKYVQSSVDASIYRDVKEKLRAGGTVFFTGTACQVAGLVSMLGPTRKQGRLITAEVICHGAPSPKLWREWVGELEESAGSKLAHASFRDKRTGWNSYSTSYEFEDGKRISHLASEDWYMRAFLNNASLRSSCFQCTSKGRSGADLTLGDYWGIQSIHKNAPFGKGASCVVAHTEAGREILGRISAAIESDTTAFESITSGNPSLTTSTARPDSYEDFQAKLATGSIDELRGAYPFKRPLLNRIASHVNAFINKVRYL